MKRTEHHHERLARTGALALVTAFVVLAISPTLTTAKTAKPGTAPVETGEAAPATELAGTATATADDTDAAAPPVNEYQTPQEVLSSGGDWPQWGGTRLRNNVPNVSGLVQTWNVGKFDRRSGDWDQSEKENVHWYAPLGSQTYGNAVIADGQVYVGTNNGYGHLPRYPAKEDLGCLLAFSEDDGKFLWQHSSEKMDEGRVYDWPLQGICSSPLVEGDRLWFVTSRGEVRCLDTEGFYDNEDDGMVKNDPAKVLSIMNAGPGAAVYAETLTSLGDGKLSDAVKNKLAAAGEPVEGDVKIEMVADGKSWKASGNFAGVDRTISIEAQGPKLNFYKTLGSNDKNEADVVWVFNMMDELQVRQHNMCNCSVTTYGDLLFVITSNGQNETHSKIPSPDAPSFICMDKNTGEFLWGDSSPRENILHGQWSSPAVGVFEGVPQVIFPGGDGILYSFRADRGVDGKPTLLWKFDCNPKTTIWRLMGEGTRNNLIATPVIYEGLVYIAVGQDPEHGEGDGHLWCIDPTGRGDISRTLAKGLDGDQWVTLEHRRIQAVSEKDGEKEVDNPNSGVVWHYSAFDADGNGGEPDFEEQLHRSIGTCAIKDDLLYVADFSGLVHCLDAKGSGDGKPIVHFTYDMLSQSWGSPLIADGHVYIGDEDGEVSIFEIGADNKEPIAEIYMGSSVYSTPVAANNKIFITTKDKLFSIGKETE